MSGQAAAYSSRMSSTPRISRAVPSWMSLFGPRLMGASSGPGTAKTSRCSACAQRAVMREPLRSVPSTTTTPRARPARIRLRTGKFRPYGGVPGGYSPISAPWAAICS